MKKVMMILMNLLICISLQSSSLQAQSSVKKYHSGFYKVSRTEDVKKGFLLKKDHHYYALHEADYLPLNAVDSVTDEFNYSTFTVIIAFKPAEKKTLHNFTGTYKDQDIGLLVNGELLLVARIVEPIANGSISYSGPFDKAHVKQIKAAIHYGLTQLAEEREEE